MIEVMSRCEVPYSRTVVLSQCFDLEPVEFVHPDSFVRAHGFEASQRHFWH